jgi:hypothetical protein
VTVFHHSVKVRPKLKVKISFTYIGTKSDGEIRHEQGGLRQDEARREDDRPHGYTQLYHTQGAWAN